MERLTFRHDAPYSKFHQKAETCEPIHCIDEYSKEALKKVVERLAAYEDTGFTPEEIQANKDAEEQGLLVRLPEPRKPLVWGDDELDAVLCPCCRCDLMGGYEDGRNGIGYMMCQCPYCGQPIDDTRVVTHKEAEKALEEANQNG